MRPCGRTLVRGALACGRALVHSGILARSGAADSPADFRRVEASLPTLDERAASLIERPAEVILRHTVENYGFASLEQAEAATKARAAREGRPPE